MWNAANRFTGWVDVPLSRKGRQEAKLAAEKISAYPINVVFTSLLVRAIETTAICLTECEETYDAKTPVFKHKADAPDWHGWDKYEGDERLEIPIFLSQALDERYYGDLQGVWGRCKTHAVALASGKGNCLCSRSTGGW